MAGERLSDDISYPVMWRTGGSRTGRTQRETFDDEGAAKPFRYLVNGQGRQWPPEWVKDEGFVKPGEPEMPDSEKFSVYAHAYVGLLTDMSEHTSECGRVAGLSGSENEGERPTGSIGREVNLRGQPAARSADGMVVWLVRRGPFLRAPAACWWARTIEKSTETAQFRFVRVGMGHQRGEHSFPRNVDGPHAQPVVDASPVPVLLRKADPLRSALEREGDGVGHLTVIPPPAALLRSPIW